MRKTNASPPTPQPKQWKIPFRGLTVNDGVFSAWNGQRPFQWDPALRRFTNRLTRSTMSTAARMSSSSVCEYCISRGSSWSADLQRGHGRACSTLGGLTVAERLDQRVTREQVADGLAEGAAALAMHQSYARQAREKGVVEIFLDSIPRLVGRLSKQQDLGGDGAGARGEGSGASEPHSPRTPPRELSPRRRGRHRSGPEDRERYPDGDRAGSDGGRASSDLDQLAADPQVLGSHGGPGGQRHRQLRGRVRRDRLDASGDLPNPATALVERTARPVRSLELVTLGGERAADLADELRRLGAGAGRREGLERLEVGRGDHERAPLGQLLEDRLGEGRAFVRIGSRAELVQEHERALVGRFEDLARLLDERRERGEVLGDGLVIPDDREDVVEHGQARALVGGHVAADLGHERLNRERLERDRLAPGVRPGDDEQRAIGTELEVHRDHRAARVLPALGEQERVAGGAKRDGPSGVDRRRRRAHALGGLGSREDPVELADRAHVPG